jgi:two-component system cell cycle response regulator DivK
MDTYPSANSILIVEDSRFFRTTLATALRDRGFNVVECATGEDGIKQARVNRPALIVMDMMMPRINGMTALRQLRGHHCTSQVPVIVLTSTATPVDAENAQRLGVVGYFAKNSVTFDGLVELIERTLELNGGLLPVAVLQQPKPAAEAVV